MATDSGPNSVSNLFITPPADTGLFIRRDIGWIHYTRELIFEWAGPGDACFRPGQRPAQVWRPVKRTIRVAGATAEQLDEILTPIDGIALDGRVSSGLRPGRIDNAGAIEFFVVAERVVRRFRSTTQNKEK
jgi:hypothetical protein